MAEVPKQPSANRDPITGAPGAHLVGTGLGAAGGGATGAAIGTAVAGPAGTLVGAAVGAIAGGLAGKGVAEMVDPTVEDTYWRENHTKEPYYQRSRGYDFYALAYRTGYEGRVKYHGRKFDEVESDLQSDYLRYKGDMSSWDEVRPASLAAWNRIDRRVLDVSNE